jgi:hypothetical protein
MSARKLLSKANIELSISLQSLVLMSVAISVSQALSKRFSHPQALARSVITGGCRRLQGLISSIPRVRLPLRQILETCSDDECASDEDTVQALFELCLAIAMQWMLGFNSQLRRSNKLCGCGAESSSLVCPTPTQSSSEVLLCFLPPLA